MNRRIGALSFAKNGNPLTRRSMKIARHPWCRASFYLAIGLLCGCSPAEQASERQADPSPSPLVGILENRSIDEASGLVRSQIDPGVLWVINDDGPAVLHAIDSTGKQLGRVKVSGADNRDWEDLASFSLQGVPYLLIADIGDNDGKRKDVRIYVVEEPDPGQSKVKIAWRIEFSYPDGRKDAEAVAVDEENERVLILTKRDIPALLYSVPLQPGSKKRQTATRLGAIGSLPQPRRRDVTFAPKTDDYYWQPTSMDISADGTRAVVLTYGGVFLFRREADTDWLDALQAQPLVVSRTRNREAESVTFNTPGDAVYITLEQRNSPLYRLDLSSMAGQQTPQPVTIMAFNVQNLFDNTDDPGKDDKAYLAIGAKQSSAHIDECNTIPVDSWRDECLNLDWSDDAIDHKLSVLATTIKQVGDGRGADIIALQEIENLAILERLRTEYLADSGYLPGILIEGQDVRGVDTAFLSRLPLAGPAKLHPLILEDYPDRVGDTRGLLEATFELPDGSLLTGFSVHFPAPFHPTELRELAYEHLNAVRSQLPTDRNVFAAGDFNTTSAEDNDQGMLERYVRPFWTVSNDNCDDCRGTAYYSRKQSWSFLDMILFSPARGAKTTWQVGADSVQIANRNIDQVSKDSTPQRYNAEARTGVSDHWPIVISIEPLEKQ
jgi:endonuclease/exonuclease/phosphatase family metal-dependent hydrolase